MRLHRHEGLVLGVPHEGLGDVVDAVNLAPALASHVREVSILVLEPPSPQILKIYKTYYLIKLSANMDIFIYSDGCKLKLYAVSTTEHKRDKMFIFIFESMFCVNKKYKL